MKTSTQKIKSVTFRCGLTLVELLVVITIIIVIAALSFLGIQKFRTKADKVGSTRVLSQLQIANASYAADHNGNYVCLYVNNAKGGRDKNWFQDQEFLSNLIGDTKHVSDDPNVTVPLSLLDPKVVRAKKPGYEGIAASYGMNSTGFLMRRDPGLAPRNTVNQIPEPSRSMAFATATDFRIVYEERFKWKDSNDVKSTDGAIAYRHGGKALVVFFDGHVGEMSHGDMKKIDAERGKSNPFWMPTPKN